MFWMQWILTRIYSPFVFITILCIPPAAILPTGCLPTRSAVSKKGNLFTMEGSSKPSWPASLFPITKRSPPSTGAHPLVRGTEADPSTAVTDFRATFTAGPWGKFELPAPVDNDETLFFSPPSSEIVFRFSPVGNPIFLLRKKLTNNDDDGIIW